MKPLIALSVLLAFAPLSQSANPEAGKAIATAVCAACHGAAGVSVDDAFPHLAGQRAAYLEAQLKALWGRDIPDQLRNGDWNYAVFTTEGKQRPGVNQAPCLACHKPLDNVSYTFTLKELAAAR